jgi:alkyl hydroperoxide reductase subunit F
MYDVIIIGGGPAATAAAVYTARKKMSTLLITESFGGQSIVSDDIQNWIGDQHVSGIELAKRFEEHVRCFPDVAVKAGEKATSVKPIDCGDDRVCDFEVTTDKGSYTGKSLIVAMGARRRRMGVPGEDEFDGKGVAFCSTCDAPLFGGKVVAVVGGGNAGLEAVMDLVPYAAKIYLLNRSEELKGDQSTQEVVKGQDKAEIIFNADTQKVLGEKFVTGLEYKDLKTGEVKTLAVGGVFVEIGSVPNSDMVRDLVDLDKFGQVKVDCKYATTSHPGIFSAGDVTEDPFKQNNISAGDGVRAALSAYAYLQKRDKKSPAEE